MGAHGYTLAEEGHFVQLFAAADQISAASSEVFSMRNYAHCTILINKGAGSVCTITVENCTSFAGAGWATMPFAYYLEGTASGDTLAARVEGGTAGVAIPVGTNTMVVIEIDDSELPDGSPYLRIKHTANTASIWSANAILSGNRFAQAITPTEIV